MDGSSNVFNIHIPEMYSFPFTGHYTQLWGNALRGPSCLSTNRIPVRTNFIEVPLIQKFTIRGWWFKGCRKAKVVITLKYSLRWLITYQIRASCYVESTLYAFVFSGLSRISKYCENIYHLQNKVGHFSKDRRFYQVNIRN